VQSDGLSKWRRSLQPNLTWKEHCHNLVDAIEGEIII
jgi:hypothetical protein